MVQRFSGKLPKVKEKSLGHQKLKNISEHFTQQAFF